jgi:hypothetical protein
LELENLKSQIKNKFEAVNSKLLFRFKILNLFGVFYFEFLIQPLLGTTHRLASKVPSNRSQSGRAKAVCEKMSVEGVRTAAIAKIATMTRGRCCFKNSFEITPIRRRPSKMMGRTNVNPKPKHMLITKEIYLPTEIKGFRSTLAKPKKNLRAMGRTRKNENAIPMRKRASEAKNMGRNAFFSFCKRPGSKNPHA